MEVHQLGLAIELAVLLVVVAAVVAADQVEVEVLEPHQPQTTQSRLMHSRSAAWLRNARNN